MTGTTWSQPSTQAALFATAGFALGPQGVSVITRQALDALQPAIPVAVAMLGVCVALMTIEKGQRSALTGHLYSAALVIAGAAMILITSQPVDACFKLAQAVAIATMLAGAGWFLASRDASEGQRRVFAIAVLLLIGGVADYLSVSGLLLGWLVAGIYRIARTPGLMSVYLDAIVVQHPVAAILLVIAGAHVQLSWPIVLGSACTAAVVRLGAPVLRRLIAPPHAALMLAPSTWVIAMAMDAAWLDTRALDGLSIVTAAAALLGVLPAGREAAA